MEMNSQSSDPNDLPSPSTINLDDYLKACGVVFTGGQAKALIQAGEVKLNGVVETRRRKKLVPGDVIEFGDLRLTVEADDET